MHQQSGTFTMRFLLLGLCLGLALAFPERDVHNERSYPRIQEVSYRPGKEYLYQYDTQVMTGLPQTSQIQAGFRISCLARVQFNTLSKVRVVFEKIVLYRINEPVVQWKATESLMPEEFLKELTGDEAVTMEHFLQIPFGFEYDDGQVLRILLEDSETSWSANIKRGFTSLFEMNLEKRFLLDESFPAIKSTTPPHANWYTVFERSTTGDCATLYTVTPNSENDHMYVTKTRDYNRCLHKPVYLKTMMDGQMVQDAQKDNPLTNGATVKYNVRGSDKKFLILSVVGEGHILLTPYKNKEQVRTSLNQTMYLKDSKQIGREVQEIPEIHHGQHKMDTLRMSLPSSSVDCQDPFMPCNEEPKQLNQKADIYSVEKIYLHLKMAARTTIEINSEESIQHLRIVKDMLKTSPEPILRQLWHRLYVSKVNPQADIERISTEILWNVLPNVATEAAANVVLDICDRYFLMTNNCTSAIRNLALKVTPTTEIVDKLIRLPSLGRLTEEVRRVSYLSLGAFGFKLTRQLEIHSKQCQQEQEMIDILLKDNDNQARSNFIRTEKTVIENRCNGILDKYQQSEEKILRTLRKLSESPKQDDKILALKAIGNTGMPGSLPILKRFFENTVDANIVRVMAVNAHRRIQYPETAKQQAIKTLLKLYLTTTETTEIRQFAFMLIAGLKPEVSVHQTIAMSLRTEKDAQLSGFVYSCFTAFSNSTYKPDWDLKENFTSALKFAPEVHTGLEQSFLKRFGLFSEDYKRGGAVSFTSVGDMTRYLGSAINIDTYNYGLISNLFEIGINTEGLSPFFNKLFGPRGMLTNNKSLFDLLKRGPRDISPQETINQIFKTLGIKERSMATPYGHLYYNIMGHELGYYDFTNLLRTISTTGQYPMTWDEEGLRMGLPVAINTMYDYADYQLTLPTEAGLPISLRVQAMSSVNIQGSLTFKVTPYMLEADRQGQPPVTLSAKVDLKPKLVGEVQCSMGLDMFYVKPIVGYRGLIKYNDPIRNELNVDLTYKRMTLKWWNPVENPVLEMLLEPFSEFTLITEKNESPVFVMQRNNIYAPTGTRVLPISQSYKINPLGIELSLNGQLPYSLSKTNPIRPLDGRSLINIFWRPMENGPSTTTLYAQYVYPIQKAVANSYAQTYQDVLTTRPEEYGRDFSRMQDSGVMKFDKFGRPLPQSPEELLPYSDPVDIKDTPINMQQMCNKFQRIFNKPMPFYNREDARALVFLLDASSKNTKRHLQLETVWNYFKDGHIGRMFTRMWRSPMQGYDTQDWQILSEMGVSYPFEVKEPKDIFDPKWQRELMKDLEYLISLETHKVVNQGINMTILSGLEQFNYPAMTTIPTYRILDSLVPEQLYRLMNMTGSTIYNRRWDHYWHDLSPVYHQIRDDLRMTVDPSFVKRDLPLMDQVTQILKVQEKFLSDLRDIQTKTVVAHAEMPVIQWIDYTQAKTVYMIREVFNKALVNDRLHEADKIHSILVQAETNVNTIVTLINQLMQKVTSVSQELNEEGKPIVVFQPQVLRQVTRQANMKYAYQETPLTNQNRRSFEREEEPSSYYTTDYGRQDVEQDDQQDSQSQLETVYKLRMSLYELTLKQMEFIEKLQLSISKVREFDFKELSVLLEHIRDNLNIIDEILMQRPIVDPVAKQSLLMVTVQNEFTIELLEQWKRIVVDKLNMKTSVEKMDLFSSKLEHLKEHSKFLGERVAMLYHKDLMQRVVVPNLDRQEYPIYKQIVELKRVMVPEYREFHRLMAYNFTNMKKPEMVVAHFDKLNERLNAHTDKIYGIERSLLNLGQVPKLYLMSELMDALHYLKFTTEFGSRTLYAINDQRRFTYLETLAQTATKIQTLISGLSPIFTKYEQYNDLDLSSQYSILNSVPIDTRVLDVQDVLVQQRMLKEQIRRFIQNPDVTSDVLSKVLNTAVDRCDMFQETLKQNQVQVKSAMQQKTQFERQSISAVWTKALTQQNNMYESLLNIYNNNRDSLRDVVTRTERINALQSEVAQMETDHQQTLESLRTQNNVNDDQPRQQWMQPLTPFQYLPNGVTALWNLNWGNGHVLNKNAKVQFMASRSVEQIMYLFRQMDAVLRSQDVVDAVNRRLGDEPWLADGVMQKFNTFSHWHFIAEAQKENLPEMLLDKLRYVQDFFKATFWNEYKRQAASKIVSKDQFQAMIDISDINKQFDLYLLNNDETNVYQGLKLWTLAEDFPVIQTYKPLREKFMSYLSYNRKPAQCMVNKDKVYTFDNVNYQMPSQMGQKEALLAADCSDDKTFAVTMVKSDTSFDGHIVKIMNEDKIVEIIPGYLDTEVKVNGKVIVLDENKPVAFYKNLHYDLYQPSLNIVRKGLRVEITFPLTGIQFLMEGTYMQLKVSELYKRRVCGLCSNFDNQMSWEFEGPRKEIYSSPRLFSQAYILREQDRHSYTPNTPEFTRQHDKYYDIVSQYRPKGDAGSYVDEDDEDLDEDKPVVADQWKISGQKTQHEIKVERKTQYQPSQIQKTADSCKPIKETDMKFRKRRGQVCFSETPVDKCPSSCSKMTDKKRVKVNYICLDAKNPEVRSLSRDIPQGPIDLMGKLGDKVTKSTWAAVECELGDLDN